MSKTIDERVVEMRFDNKQFESATATTMSTIDKLKQKLNFTGATKGLENVNNAAKNVNMSGLSSAVETVQARFSSLQVIAMTALSNITNSAINAGKNIISSLTLEPITTGFQEYETQMNAVQTILANTSHEGTNIEDVTKALDELNQYADQTIYNFTEMTRNIGTFTAAGVSLDKSVTSIKGIANLAAVSGSSAQQASVAMYQLSQALAAGRVSLMDWNSVVNAGMGGKVFQDALKRTAEHFGYNVDSMIAKYGSFRESLTQGGWLTAEVLTETLTQLSGAYTEADLIAQGYSESQAKAIVELAETAVGAATDIKTFTQLMDTTKEAVQSGWAKTWQIIFGDFEEAKETFSMLSNDVIAPFIEQTSSARNNLLEAALTSSWKKISNEIRATGIDIEDFQEKATELGKKYGKVTDKMIEDAGGFEKSLKSGWLTSDLVAETLRNMAGGMEGVSQSTEDMNKKLEYFQKVVHDVWMGDYKNGQERIEALTKAGYDYATVQDLVNKTVDGHKLTLADLSVEQAANLGLTEAQIEELNKLADAAEKSGTSLNDLIGDLTKPSGRELLLGSFSNALQGLLKIITTVREAWAEVFPPNSEALYNTIEAINNFSKSLVMSDDTADNLRRTLKGLFAIIDIITTIVGGGFKFVFQTVAKILGMADVDILSMTASVGDMVVAFRDWLLENNFVVRGINKLSEYLAEGIKQIKEWIESLKDSKDLPHDIANGLVNGFGKAISFVSDVISEMISHVAGGFKQLPDDMISGLVRGLQNGMKIAGETIMELGTLLLEKIKEVLGIHSPSTEFFAIGENIITGLIEGLKSMLSGLWELLKSIGSGIIGIIKEIDFGTIFAAAISAGFLYGFIKLGNALNTIMSPLDGLGDLLDSAAKALGSFSLTLKAEAIKSIAVAIAILAGSLVVLSMVDPIKLGNALASLIVLSAVIAGLTVVVGKFGATKGILDVAKMTGTIMAISVSLLLLSGVLKILGSMEWGEIGKAAAGVAALGAVMVAIIAALSLVEKDIDKVGPTIRKMATSFLLLAIVMRLIGGMEWGEMGKAAAGIAGLTVFVTALILVTNLASDEIDKVGPTLSKLAAAMLILVIVAKLINTMTWPEMGKALVGLTGLTAIVGALIFLTNFSGNKLDNVGSTLLKFSGVLAILAVTARLIGGMTFPEMAKALVGIAGLTAVIAALVAITNLFKEKDLAKLGSTLLMMSISIGILAAISTLLGLVDIKYLAKGLVAVGLLTTMMSMMVLATKDAKNILGNLIVMSIAIAVMTASVAALAMIDTTKMATSTAALSLLMGMFSLMIKMSSGSKSAIASLASITVVVGLLAGVIYLLSGLPVESVLGVSASLSVLLLSLSASLAIISTVGKTSASAIVSVALMSAVLAVLTGVLYLLGGLPIESTMAATASLMTLLIGLSAALVILSAVGAAGPASFVGIGALATLIAGVGTLMVVIGALTTYFPSLEQFLDKGIGMLEKIGYGLGSFFGNIVGGFSAGVASGLPEIGEHLSAFMDNLQPFIDGASGIDPAVLDGVKSLAQAILILSAANIVEGIASWLTGGSSMADFATQLVPFGQAMKEFSVAIAGMDADLVNNAAIAGKTLAEMAATIPNAGGVAAFFAGENDMGVFAQQLIPFGEAMKEFSIAIEGMNPELVSNAATAGKALAEMAATVPNSGGVVGFFAGENDMDMFAEQLIPFGEAMKGFADVVVGLDGNAVANAATAGKALTELADTVPNTGGLISFLVGQNDLSMFGTQLVAFGTSIMAFSASVTGLNPEIIEGAATAGKTMVELANTLPNTGGLVTFFTGGNDMAAFGGQLVSFGDSFKQYADSVKDIDPNVVTSTANAAQSLVTLANALPENKLFTNETWIDEFGGQLASFGSSFSMYYNNIVGIDTAKLNSVITEANRLVAMARNMSGLDLSGMSSFGRALANLGKKGIDEFISAFTNASGRASQAVSDLLSTFTAAVNSKRSQISTSFTNLVNDALNALRSKYGEFNTTGQTLMTQFISGVRSREGHFRTTFSTMIVSALTQIRSRYTEFMQAGMQLMLRFIEGIKANEPALLVAFETPLSSMITSINNKRSAFYSAGAYLVQGFADGISANTFLAESRAAAMANASYNSAMRALDAHSPSRLFMKVGSYVSLGFARGIENETGAVEDSSAYMANAAIENTKKTLSKIVDSINNGIDSQPTIRPVLDLSDVETKTHRLNTLFTSRRAMKIGASMNPGSFTVNDQNGATDAKNQMSINFTQYNTSPKALSRIEIYRQTKNLFSTLERTVTT